jgi:hypothetical protein
MTVNATTTVPRYARFIRGLQQRYVNDLPGGPRILTFATVINFQKCLVFVYLGALVWLYRGHTPAATSDAAWHALSILGRSLPMASMLYPVS